MNDKFETPTVKIEEILNRMNASSVFGEPIREGATIVVPVAEVMYGFGAGGGYGKPAEGAPADTDEKKEMGEGGGSGSGGGGRVKPVGFIRLSADGAYFEPTMNPAVIPLAGIAMVAWTIFWITATIRAFVRK